MSEAIKVEWKDLQPTAPRQVRLHGKGKRDRVLPLWRETANAPQRLRSSQEANGTQYVFLNRQGQSLTRDGVAYILRKYVTAVALERPALARKRITPHIVRHSCAVALLQSGTD